MIEGQVEDLAEDTAGEHVESQPRLGESRAAIVS